MDSSWWFRTADILDYWIGRAKISLELQHSDCVKWSGINIYDDVLSVANPHNCYVSVFITYDRNKLSMHLFMHSLLFNAESHRHWRKTVSLVHKEKSTQSGETLCLVLHPDCDTDLELIVTMWDKRVPLGRCPSFHGQRKNPVVDKMDDSRSKRWTNHPDICPTIQHLALDWQVHIPRGFIFPRLGL